MALDDLSLGADRNLRPSRRGPLWLLGLPFRFLFRLIKRTLAGIIRSVAHHPAGTVIVLLLALVGFLGYQDYGMGRLGLGLGLNSASGASDASVAPSTAAENFIKGQTTFDANLMWQSFSDDFKQTLTQRGTSQQTLQRQMDQRKQSGTKVENVKFGGGVASPDGSRVFLYVVTMDIPGNQDAVETHYVLTVDPTDKISKVE